MLRFLNIVLFSAAVGCGVGYLSFRAEPADYQSTARIVIASPSEPLADSIPDAQPPADRGVAGGVAQAKRELVDSATLGRALESSLLLGVQPAAGMLSHEQLRQCLGFDEADEPPDTIVITCRAASAELSQVLLTSVIDAYLVRAGQQQQAGSDQTRRMLEQARRAIQAMRAHSIDEAQRRSLVAALSKPVVDPAVMQQLSQQRAELILRRNHLQRELAQLERGKPEAVVQDRPKSRRSANARAPVAPIAGAAAPVAAIAPGVGVEERVAQLLEEDRALAARYGANHPKRQGIRLQIELLQRYPVEQAQLLAEQWSLLQQFGPDHPNLKQIRQRLDELGVTPLAKADTELIEHPAAVSGSEVDAMVGASAATPQQQREALQAALKKIDEQDAEFTRKVDEANQARELAAQLRQALENLPGRGELETVQAAIDRCGPLAAVQSAVRPYLAQRPTLGVRSFAGLDRKLLTGAGAGAGLGALLALAMMLAGGARRSPA